MSTRQLCRVCLQIAGRRFGFVGTLLGLAVSVKDGLCVCACVLACACSHVLSCLRACIVSNRRIMSNFVVSADPVTITFL